jgi:hypothetical protein
LQPSLDIKHRVSEIALDEDYLFLRKKQKLPAFPYPAKKLMGVEVVPVFRNRSHGLFPCLEISPYHAALRHLPPLVTYITAVR